MKVEAEADFDEEESRPDIASFSDILFSHNLDLEDSQRCTFKQCLVVLMAACGHGSMGGVS